MIRQAKIRFREKTIGIKTIFNKNKRILYGIILSVVVGILWALIAMKGTSHDSALPTLIKNNTLNVAVYLLKVALLSFVFYVLSAFTGVNRCVFLLNFLIVLLFSKYYFQTAFICAADGFCGFVLLFVYYVPLFIINVILFTLFLIESYQNTCAGTNWRYFSPFPCLIRWSFGRVRKFALCSVILNLLWAAIVLIVLYRIL